MSAPNSEMFYWLLMKKTVTVTLYELYFGQPQIPLPEVFILPKAAHFVFNSQKGMRMITLRKRRMMEEMRRKKRKMMMMMTKRRMARMKKKKEEIRGVMTSDSEKP